MTATRTLAATLTERQQRQTVPEPQLTQSALALALTLTSTLALALALSPLDSSRVDSTLDSDYVLCLGERDLGFPLPAPSPFPFSFALLFSIFHSALFCSVLFCFVILRLSLCVVVFVCLRVCVAFRYGVLSHLA